MFAAAAGACLLVLGEPAIAWIGACMVEPAPWAIGEPAFASKVAGAGRPELYLMLASVSTRRTWAGQVALVTGASSGVGKAIALALTDQGAAVCLAGRHDGRLEETRAAGNGSGALAYSADLTRPEELRGLADQVVADFGGVDVLVHAAGVISSGSVEDSLLPDFDRQYETNLRAPYALTQLLLPSLRERQGQVVFINSTQGVQAGPGASQYAATKHGLRALADSLRAEVNADGVRVLTVMLGQTATCMQEELHRAQGRAYHPERLIQPKDAAHMVVAGLLLPRTAEVTELSMRPLQGPAAA
jgi:NAD(P)-dependent dehydrogenase (short-subunit alcohol dehydrogenase family)